MERKNNNWLQKAERGVMTVEASVIVPMILIILAILMVLTFYVHNRNYYIAAGYEAALTGNAWYAPEDDPDQAVSQKAARDKAEERIKGQPFPGSEPEPQLSFSGNDVTGYETAVSFTGQKFPAFSSTGWFDWTVEVKARKINPVTAKRLVRAGKNMIKTIAKSGHTEGGEGG